MTSDPVLDPASFSTTLSPTRAERLFQGIPGIERSPGGLLWATWYAGGPDQPGEGPNNFLVLAASRDGGLHWEETALVHPPTPELRVFDPCLWVDPLGRLWLFWAQSGEHFDGRAGVWASIAEHPDDPATGWSAPRRLCHGVMMNKPTVLSNGDWLLPAAVWRRGPRRHDFSSIGGSGVVASADQGATWHLRGRAVPENPSYDEQMVLEGNDGSLRMLIRTRDGIAQSLSTDAGRTWSPTRIAGIPHADSRFFLRRLASGRVLLVTHNPPTKGDAGLTGARSHLTAWLSEDDGATWRGGLLLDEREGISYPDGVEEPDGRIRIIYDRDRQHSREILLATFSESEILSGEIATGTLRQRVS